MANSSFESSAADPSVMAQRLMRRAHNQDGLPEIAVGLIFLLISGLLCVQVLLPRDSIAFQAAAVAFAFLLPVVCLGSPWALKQVRRRYLIERVGYVEQRPTGRKQIGIGIMLSLAMAAVLFGVVTRLSRPDGWLLAGTGLVGGGLAASCGRLPRFIIGGILVALTGVVLAFSGVSLEIGFAILFGLQGLMTFISGGVVFLRFVRHANEGGE